MYNCEFTPLALQQLRKLSPEIRQRIIKKLEFFLSTDKPLDFASHLTNYNLGQYRFRIGDYRVTFDVDESAIVILTLGHRREIYK